MSIKIDSSASRIAQEKGLNLKGLQEKELKKLDSDRDGVISKGEMEKAFKLADINNDGYISSDENTKFQKLVQTDFKSGLAFSADMADLVKKLGPEKTGKLFKFINSISGGDEESAKKILGALSKQGNALEAVNKMLKAADAFDSGKIREGTSYSLEALADVWSALPDRVREKTAEKFGRLLSRIPKLGGFASLIGDMEKIGATPGLMKMVAGALRGDGKAIEGGFKSVLKGIEGADAATKAKIGGKLMVALGKILPKSVMAKLAGKKVPGISLGIAAYDLGKGIYNLFSGDSEQAIKDFISAGSGALGTIPGWGTAASTAIDLGMLTYDVVDAFKSLSNTEIGENPFAP